MLKTGDYVKCINNYQLMFGPLSKNKHYEVLRAYTVKYGHSFIEIEVHGERRGYRQDQFIDVSVEVKLETLGL